MKDDKVMTKKMIQSWIFALLGMTTTKSMADDLADIRNEVVLLTNGPKWFCSSFVLSPPTNILLYGNPITKPTRVYECRQAETGYHYSGIRPLIDETWKEHLNGING